jgi:hypothetical protein
MFQYTVSQRERQFRAAGYAGESATSSLFCEWILCVGRSMLRHMSARTRRLEILEFAQNPQPKFF